MKTRYIQHVLLLAVGLAMTAPSAGNYQYLIVEVDEIPVERLIENLERKLRADPDNAELLLNLGRAHAMAATKHGKKVEVRKDDDSAPWFGYEHNHLPFVDRDKKRHDLDPEEKEHLRVAIKYFKKAIEEDSENLTARLSHAWTLDRANKEMEAITAYREVIEAGWEKENDMTVGGLGFRSIVAEAAGYLIPMLDEKDDADEIADLRDKVVKVNSIPRPITPIAIPLGPSMGFDDVYNDDAAVRFDADGSGFKKEWTWIHPDAGWLVYDKKGKGHIHSALQLFGNVTFWCFWSDGYSALSSLDSDDDGILSGDELEHLAIWCDANENGISDPGEVRPVTDFEIVAIECVGKTLAGKSDVLWNKSGVRFRDGTVHPTYDVVLRTR